MATGGISWTFSCLAWDMQLDWATFGDFLTCATKVEEVSCDRLQKWHTDSVFVLINSRLQVRVPAESAVFSIGISEACMTHHKIV